MMPVDESYSVGSHWLALKSSRKWILACTLIAAVGAGVFSSLQPKIFRAKTLLLDSESARHHLQSANNHPREFNRTSGIEKRRKLIRSLSEQISQDETRLSHLKVEL